MRTLLVMLLIALLGPGCTQGLFTGNGDGYEFEGYQIVFSLEAPETVAGQPVGYTAWLVDAEGDDVEGAAWALSSDLQSELDVTASGLVPVVAGDHTITATATYEGATFDKSAPLTVLADAPYDLDLRLDDVQMQAGGAIGYEVSVIDAWGNDVETGPVPVTVDSPDVTQSAGTLQSVVPGTYFAEATYEGLSDAEPFVVVPGPPDAVDLALSTTDLELFQTTSATVTVVDAWGNPTDDAWTLSTDRPAASAVSFRNVTFFEEGWHTVSVRVDGTTLTDEVGPFLIDSTGPVLEIDAPMRGAWRTSSSTTVRGTATDAWSGLVDLYVDDAEVAVASDGSFSHSIGLGFGANVVETWAVDLDGNASTDTRSVLKGNYLSYGSTVPGGIQVNLGEGWGGFDTLEAIGEGLVRDTDLDALIPWPLYETSGGDCPWGCYEAEIIVYNPSIGNTDLLLEPRCTGQFRMKMRVYAPHLDWWAYGMVEALGIGIDTSGTGSIDANYIEVEIYATPGVSSSGAIEMNLDSVTAHIDGFDFEWKSWLWDVIEWIDDGLGGWIEGEIARLAEDAIRDAVVDEVPAALEGALQDLELDYQFPLQGRAYTLSATPGSIEAECTQATLGLDTTVTVDQWEHAGWGGWGSLYRPYTPPAWNSSDRPVNVGLSGDLVNQVLYAAWGGGLLDIEQGSDALGLSSDDLETLLPGTSSLTVQVEPLLPPVAVPASGAAEMELQVGDLHLTLFDGPIANNDVLLEAYVTAYAPLDLGTDGATSLTADIGEPELYFDVVVPEANSMAAADTEALLQALVPLLLPQLSEAIGEIELPQFDDFEIRNISLGTGGSYGGYLEAGGYLYER